MKKNILYTLIIFITACTGGVKKDLSSFPVVNTISDLNHEKGVALPFTNEEGFLASGKIKSNAYLLGKGIIELTDLEDPNESLYILTKHKYKVGETISIKISKKEIASLDDDALDMYIEI